jgi:hypothetical protein
MTPKEFLCTSVDDLRSTLKCSEASGHTDTEQIEQALAMMEGYDGSSGGTTRRKLLEATLKRWRQLNIKAESKILRMTKPSEFAALTPGEQFRLLETAEFDRNGYYRNGQDGKKAARITELSLRIEIATQCKRVEDLERAWDSQSRELGDAHASIKTLRRQIQELAQEPLR